MSGKFEVTQRADGWFEFKLKSPNGTAVIASSPYRHMASVLKGIESVRNNASDARVVDLSDDA